VKLTCDGMRSAMTPFPHLRLKYRTPQPQILYQGRVLLIDILPGCIVTRMRALEYLGLTERVWNLGIRRRLVRRQDTFRRSSFGLSGLILCRWIGSCADICVFPSTFFEPDRRSRCRRAARGRPVPNFLVGCQLLRIT
jgi:hypothetical protein